MSGVLGTFDPVEWISFILFLSILDSWLETQYIADHWRPVDSGDSGTNEG